MKKIALLLVIAISLSTMLTSCSMLPDDTVGKMYDFFDGGKNYSKGINYRLNSNGYGYTVSKFYGSDNDVRIRSTFKNMPVTAIADNAFKNNYNITTVTIPGSVTSIGESAFAGCTSLTSITIPDSVTSIGEYAFGECTNLTRIDVDENNKYYKSIDGNLYNKDGKTLIRYAPGKTDTSFIVPNSVTCFEISAFNDCTNLTSITVSNIVENVEKIRYIKNIKDVILAIPYGKTTISDEEFYILSGVTKVNIPDGVTRIGKSAFGGSHDVTSVTLPDSLYYIDSFAFLGCDSLTSITIPENVISIGMGAFGGCFDLTSIDVDEDNLYYKSIDGNLYTKDGRTIMQYANGKSDTSFTIPDGVVTISHAAFFWCENLTSVVIPNSVSSIEGEAFSLCTSLTTIYYKGTEAEWNKISKVSGWNPSPGNYTVIYNYKG